MIPLQTFLRVVLFLSLSLSLFFFLRFFLFFILFPLLIPLDFLVRAGTKVVGKLFPIHALIAIYDEFRLIGGTLSALIRGKTVFSNALS